MAHLFCLTEKYIISPASYILVNLNKNIMAVRMDINGYLGITFHDIKTGKEVDRKTEKAIAEKLQTGDYVIGIVQKLIYDLSDFENPPYAIEIDSTDGVEFDWDVFDEL